MKWNELTVSVPTLRLDEAEAVANMATGHGIYVEDYSDLESGAEEIAHIDLIDEELRRRDKSVAKIHIFIDGDKSPAEEKQYICEMLKAAGIDCTVELTVVDDADWSENWKKYFRQTNIGERLSICPSWETPDGGDRQVIMLDPGAAFGTGTHATTRMCMELLEDYCFEGCRTFDVGCGSGILSIAALKLGAGQSDGADIDPVSVRVARENAEVNGVGGKSSFVEGSIDKAEGLYDVICANIVADVIIMLSGDMASHLKDGAVIICSGIIDGRESEVEAALVAAGLTVDRRVTVDNWHAIAAVKKVG